MARQGSLLAYRRNIIALSLLSVNRDKWQQRDRGVWTSRAATFAPAFAFVRNIDSGVAFQCEFLFGEQENGGRAVSALDVIEAGDSSVCFILP